MVIVQITCPAENACHLNQTARLLQANSASTMAATQTIINLAGTHFT